MTIWFTADTHFSHEKVARLRGFDDVKKHDAAIMDDWERRVGDNDTVFVLGDFAMGGQAGVLDVARRVFYMPGDKHLVLGNHDRAHPCQKNGHKHYLAATAWDAFWSVATAGEVRHDGHKMLLSHFPYDGDHTAESRFDQWRLRDLGVPLVHGHTHSTERLSFSGRGTPQVCVSWEAWGRLVNIGEVTALLEEVGHE